MRFVPLDTADDDPLPIWVNSDQVTHVYWSEVEEGVVVATPSRYWVAATDHDEPISMQILQVTNHLETWMAIS